MSSCKTAAMIQLPCAREMSGLTAGEGADEDGDGNGEFTPATVGDAAEGWIAYIVAEK